MQHNDATKAQIEAAQPDRSTWLSANAGSGKTRVLTDRVARLLLDGVNPQNILCLTYTKAAASEMQNRLIQRLGAWAMLTDVALLEQLRELGLERPIEQKDLREARRLFACAIETPGGLKIQTIHSFCSALLRRFPLEAGVTPQFTEMEDRIAKLLRAEIIEEIAAGPHADLLFRVAQQYSDESFDKLSKELVKHQSVFSAPLSTSDLKAYFGQDPDLSVDDIARTVFLGDESAILPRLIAMMKQGTITDVKNAEKLARITDFNSAALPILEDVFLTGSGAQTRFSAKLGSVPTKSTQKKLSDIMPQLEALMMRVETACHQRLNTKAIEKTRVMHDFAQVFLPAYKSAKELRGWLDFDDLILKAKELLSDRSVADWVLFRLDGAIDHILVDEAQDTSPVQWQVIQKLASEWTSGVSARSGTHRTLFVVGDKKQSIYSFQGADPSEFDRMQEEFAARLKNSGAVLNEVSLAYSFRSSRAILDLVDHTFSKAERSGFTPKQSHKAFKANMPGRVDLWPVIPKPEKEERPNWHDPVDIKATNDPSVLLAQRIAHQIKQMLDRREPMPQPPEHGGPYRWRSVEPGDFLILVQRRSGLFHEIIRACKALDLPIAGADRLKVGAELAVRDLVALLSFLTTPEDSLSLATALKSPLFGWTEAELYALAHPRETPYLWPALRDQAERYPETTGILHDLLSQADFLRPFDLIERILTRHNGRHRLLSRLGPEAEEGLDALLAQAMAYEKNAVDSLTGFLLYVAADDLEIKRQMETAGNRIRVMTVHGAKGLEAPIVILPDTAKRDVRIKDQIILHEDFPFWRTTSDDSPDVIQEATEKAKAIQRAERDRMLYVAMTRAENWLIVAAAGDLGSDGESWYDKIKDGLEAAGANDFEFDGGTGLRLSHGVWAETETEIHHQTTDDLVDLPDHFTQPAREMVHPEPTISPSSLGGAKALPGDAGQDEEAAKLRGRQLHRLLEILPQWSRTEWSALSERILGHGADTADKATCADLLNEARRVLDHPELTRLMSKDVLREAPITANIEALGGRRLHGIIDLLIIDEKQVWAIDFKTNATVPTKIEECPDGLLRQMGAYAQALQLLYPDRHVETGLFWTRTSDLMMLPTDIVTDALRASPMP